MNHWDQLNRTRKIIGFSAIDAHENQNLRARYLPDGQVLWVGNNGKNIDTMEVSFWNKLPGRFKIIHQGRIIKTSLEESYEFNFGECIQKGNYWIEMDLNLQGTFIPWLYTNPIVMY